LTVESRAWRYGAISLAIATASRYALVGENGLENTQVVLTGVTPGGEFKFASRSGYGQASRGWGFFGSLFGGPYYNRPQGYYGPPPAYSRW
jgi:hypothetical protein